MTRKLLLVTLVAGLGWWYLVGNARLSEDQVGDFYRGLERAMVSRSTGQLCEMLAEDFRSEGVVNVAGRHSPAAQDKTQACASYDHLYASWDQIGKNLGGMVQLHSGYKIHSVELSTDRKSATVDISMSMLVGGTLMDIRSRSTDTLVRRNGKIVLLRTEGRGAVNSASL